MTKETYIKELDKILKRTTTIEELEKIKTEIKEYCENYGIYDWGIIHIVEKHIKELKGDK